MKMYIYQVTITLICFLEGAISLNKLYMENKLIATISIATHEKPGCKASLIDNTLTNSTGKLLLSECHTISKFLISLNVARRAVHPWRGDALNMIFVKLT